MSPQDQFRLLTGLSLVDGQIQSAEREVLMRAAAGLGLDRDEAGAVVRDVMAGGKVTNLSPPEDPIERGVLFQHMVDLVAADGEVSAQERAVLERLAGPFGVDLAMIPAIAAPGGGAAGRRSPRSSSPSLAGL